MGEAEGVAGRLLGAGGKKGRLLPSETEVRRFSLPAHFIVRLLWQQSPKPAASPGREGEWL